LTKKMATVNMKAPTQVALEDKVSSCSTLKNELELIVSRARLPSVHKRLDEDSLRWIFRRFVKNKKTFKVAIQVLDTMNDDTRNSELNSELNCVTLDAFLTSDIFLTTHHLKTVLNLNVSCVYACIFKSRTLPSFIKKLFEQNDYEKLCFVMAPCELNRTYQLWNLVRLIPMHEPRDREQIVALLTKIASHSEQRIQERLSSVMSLFVHRCLDEKDMIDSVVLEHILSHERFVPDTERIILNIYSKGKILTNTTCLRGIQTESKKKLLRIIATNEPAFFNEYVLHVTDDRAFGLEAIDVLADRSQQHCIDFILSLDEKHYKTNISSIQPALKVLFAKAKNLDQDILLMKKILHCCGSSGMIYAAITTNYREIFPVIASLPTPLFLKFDVKELEKAANWSSLPNKVNWVVTLLHSTSHTKLSLKKNYFDTWATPDLITLIRELSIPKCHNLTGLVYLARSLFHQKHRSIDMPTVITWAMELFDYNSFYVEHMILEAVDMKFLELLNEIAARGGACMSPELWNKIAESLLKPKYPPNSITEESIKLWQNSDACTMVMMAAKLNNIDAMKSLVEHLHNHRQTTWISEEVALKIANYCFHKGSATKQLLKESCWLDFFACNIGISLQAAINFKNPDAVRALVVRLPQERDDKLRVVISSIPDFMFNAGGDESWIELLAIDINSIFKSAVKHKRPATVRSLLSTNMSQCDSADLKQAALLLFAETNEYDWIQSMIDLHVDGLLYCAAQVKNYDAIEYMLSMSGAKWPHEEFLKAADTLFTGSTKTVTKKIADILFSSDISKQVLQRAAQRNCAEVVLMAIKRRPPYWEFSELWSDHKLLGECAHCLFSNYKLDQVKKWVNYLISEGLHQEIIKIVVNVGNDTVLLFLDTKFKWTNQEAQDILSVSIKSDNACGAWVALKNGAINVNLIEEAYNGEKWKILKMLVECKKYDPNVTFVHSSRIYRLIEHAVIDGRDDIVCYLLRNNVELTNKLIYRTKQQRPLLAVAKEILKNNPNRQNTSIVKLLTDHDSCKEVCRYIKIEKAPESHVKVGTEVDFEVVNHGPNGRDEFTKGYSINVQVKHSWQFCSHYFDPDIILGNTHKFTVKVENQGETLISVYVQNLLINTFTVKSKSENSDLSDIEENIDFFDDHSAQMLWLEILGGNPQQDLSRIVIENILSIEHHVDEHKHNASFVVLKTAENKRIYSQCIVMRKVVESDDVDKFYGHSLRQALGVDLVPLDECTKVLFTATSFNKSIVHLSGFQLIEGTQLKGKIQTHIKQLRTLLINNGTWKKEWDERPSAQIALHRNLHQTVLEGSWKTFQLLCEFILRVRYKKNLLNEEAVTNSVLGGADGGIDITVQLKDGKRIYVQAKHMAQVKRSDISKFLNECQERAMKEMVTNYEALFICSGTYAEGAKTTAANNVTLFDIGTVKEEIRNNPSSLKTVIQAHAPQWQERDDEIDFDIRRLLKVLKELSEHSLSETEQRRSLKRKVDDTEQRRSQKRKVDDTEENSKDKKKKRFN
jgi:hypothetical protein